MSEFIQTVIVAAVLILALGFIVYRLSVRSKGLLTNKAPSCHGDDGNEESCPHCEHGSAK